MANSRLCSIPDCGKPAQGLGYCNAHYSRFRRNGDPMGVRTPNGDPLRFYEKAKLYDSDECLLWPYATTSAGYGVINVGDGNRIVSRLLCEEEYGPAPEPSMDAAHSCGNGHLGCIAKRHLSWKTRVENAADRLLHGTVSRGEKHGLSKLTDRDIREIRSLIGTITNLEIAKRFGVTDRTVSKIKLGQRWAHIQ